MRLFGWSLFSLALGTLAALLWGPGWWWLAGLGALGALAAVVLYLWGALSGRRDPFGWR